MMKTSLSETEALRLRMRDIAINMREQDIGWQQIAIHLNKQGFKTQKGTPWRALTVYKMVTRNETAEKKHAIKSSTSAAALRLELARAAARSKHGTPEERLQTVADLLQ